MSHTPRSERLSHSPQRHIKRFIFTSVWSHRSTQSLNDRSRPTHSCSLPRTHAHTLAHFLSVSHRSTQPLHTFILSSRAVKFHQSYFLSDFMCFLCHSVWYFSCPAAHRRLKLLSKVTHEREEERYGGERGSKSALYFTAFGLDLQLIRSWTYL